MPEKMTLHFKDGSTTSMDAIDARHVLRQHSTEWSTSPFPEEVQKEALAEAAALRDLLANMRADGKNEHEVEKARLAWPDTWKAMKAKASASAADTEPAAPFEGRDKGAGWWGIFDSNGKQIGGNIRKPEAESFNGLSDEDKAEWLKSELAKS
jgi:hypothetical protein